MNPGKTASNQSRTAILKRLRQGRGDQPMTVPASDFAVVRDRNWTPAERLDRFEARICSVNGEVHRVAREQWIDTLYALMKAKGLENLLVSEDVEHGRELRRLWPWDAPALLGYEQPIEHWKPAMFNNVAAALTGCLGAIAETGSLMLWPTPQEPRLMSLVPPVHFVLLAVDCVYDTFHQAMAEQQWAQQGMPTNALLISGPSKTADIEQTLAYGVHGPRELVVLILE